ncbi:MAG: PLP-dependent lyase/thiolase [Candidatus Magasanikbacteria bacterium]
MKTPQQTFPELNRALGIEVYLKREDMHKYGSHKGRSIPYMVKKYAKEDGIKKFVISSSGNAALAAIHTVQAHNRNNEEKLELTVYIGNNIDAQKLKMMTAVIEDPKVQMLQVERPKQTALQTEKEGEIKILRQSSDDTALVGYAELADELNKIPNLNAIFIPTSSGTTVQALGMAFETIKPSTWGGKQFPQLHIVQTTACHPMSELFDTDTRTTKTSIAGAIVDNVAFRKEKVKEIIDKTKGFGWIVTDDEIKEAQKLIKDTCNLAISPNSALSIAGLIRAQKKGYTFDGVVVCLITGL